MNLPFLWGAATSAHQVEGQNALNDWWAWEEASRVRERSGAACDHYQRFAADFDLARQLGHTAHRFSIEWSRLEPRENVWDEEAFRHYEEVLEALRERGIEPIVTLHHFTNPQWLAAEGGWLNPKVVFYFARFAQRAAERFGKWVKFWITINEPTIYLYHGFYSGIWPPGFQSGPLCFKVFRHQLEAHLEAYRRIHAVYETNGRAPVWVSIAHHVGYFEPARKDSWLDHLTVKLREYFFNYFFIDSLQSGFLFLPGIFCEYLSGRGALDFIGINYYTRTRLRFGGWKGIHLFGDNVEVDEKDNLERNSLGWEVCAEGLEALLKRLHRYRLPIMIAENGICCESDEQRQRFIADHLAALARARAQGVNVFGYLYWSLLDNFEWADGFGPRFGLIEVDYSTQNRKIRKSAQILSETCRNLTT